MINSIYICYYNNMFWRKKNIIKIEIKNLIVYCFVYILKIVLLDVFYKMNF